jgi:hypothetical protein
MLGPVNAKLISSHHGNGASNDVAAEISQN